MRIFLLLFFVATLPACQMDYYLKSGYGQALLIKNQKPITEVLDKVTPEQKTKLLLVLKAKEFAENDLGLAKSDNYTTYVGLDRKYVTYIVQAAQPFELKYHYWHFPLVGSIPYKGFFEEKDAREEAHIYDEKGLDTYIRGVRAFSTLGWLKDAVLSPMLDYDNDDLVNTIIHETTHTTLYIKSNADFNEQLATFVGNKGTELFYKKLEGDNSATLKIIEQKNGDEKLFSEFITKELKDLEQWYKDHPKVSKEEKQKRLSELQTRFEQIKFKTKGLEYFKNLKLNNAVLLGYKTYVNDLSQFEKVFERKKSMKAFIEAVKKLEKSKDPSKDLAKIE
jgi:predicted aminopeptidase